MNAMILDAVNRPLRQAEVEEPEAGAGQVKLRVRVCGVCRTDLHIVDGDLTEPKLPLILGHQIIGEVVATGSGVDDFAEGDRVGVPWLGWTDGTCRYCRHGQENLCDGARFTGYDIDGGYAEYAVADHRYCFPVPDGYPDLQAAPLLCAGLIGYRSLRKAGDGRRLGFYGFGSAAHILTQVAVHEG
ncbi:MAG: alcohol dehydrogenase catalytic domain-containing protein, partial [Gemmatimonadetes bacterium]|nr:alcohol dehydrogenase catalytic domain-containing protein [Gemmatimonadota bacterium]